MAPTLDKVCTLEAHSWECSSVHFHPAANMLVTGGWDRTIRIWDVEDEAELRVIDRRCHQGPVTCVRWHPNGALLASTSSDNTTCLWDASTGEKMRVLREHFGWVLQCSFAPDRTKLATASWDKTVRLWDPNTGELISTLRSHTKGVYACEFYPVGHTSALLATAGEDATAKLWDTRTRKVALTLSGGHVDAIHSVAWSNDGSLIATGSADRTVTIWDPKAGKILRLLKGHEGTVKSALFAPVNSYNSSNILITAGGYSSIVWNPDKSSNNILAENFWHNEGKEVEAVAISHDGKLVATGGRDGNVVVAKVPAYRSDALEGHNPRQTKAAESWLKQGQAVNPRLSVHVPDLKPTSIHKRDAQETIERAMRDESSSWLKRRQLYENPNEKANEGSLTQSPSTRRKLDSRRLLESRGFQQDGQLDDRRAQEVASEQGDRANLGRRKHMLQQEKEELRGFDFADDDEGSADGRDAGQRKMASDSAPMAQPAKSDESRNVPLRKTGMLDDKGKVHPMIAAARKKDTPARNVPAQTKLDDVDSLMALLRQKTETNTSSGTTDATTKQVNRKSSSLQQEDLSVEALLEISRPKLVHKPRVRTTSMLFPSQKSGQGNAGDETDF